MTSKLPDDARLIASDYERMMAEAEIVFTGHPDKLAVAKAAPCYAKLAHIDELASSEPR
jgi:hypothetical protein